MSVDRVTKAGNSQNISLWLQAGQRRLSEAQQQISSGRRVNVASDDPAGSGQILANRRQLGRLLQLERNTQSARAWLETSSGILTGSSDTLRRARTLIVQAANEISPQTSRDAIAQELDVLAETLLGLANTRVTGRPLFGGTADTGLAFAPDGTYLGASDTVNRAVDRGQVIQVGRPGPEVFGAHDPTEPLDGNVFQLLRAAADAARSGDTAALRTALDRMEVADARLLNEASRLGALSNRLEGVSERRDVATIDTRRRLSELEDADLAEAVLSLRSAEAGYQATLAATAKLVGTSLLDFLR
jgi:flagellar hook-associated protein 3 FlgL